MQVRVFDEGAEQDCLLVLGWGNRCRHETVQWLIDRVAERYRVHVAELPTHITDFRREWLDPLREYAADLDDCPALGHSAGGLTLAHLDDGITNRVYLSPWWGTAVRLPQFLVDMITSLPISRPLVPSGVDSRAALGTLATDEQVRDNPTAYSPAFARTTARAQERLPPAREDAVAFVTLTDSVVDPRAVGKRLPADRIRLYDGGHELFSSPARKQHIDDVLAALDSGPDAIDAR